MVDFIEIRHNYLEIHHNYSEIRHNSAFSMCALFMFEVLLVYGVLNFEL